MKSLLIILLLFGNTRCGTTTVYICDSSNAVRYHYNEHCRGLSNCRYHILKTTLENAKAKNLTLCGWEREH